MWPGHDLRGALGFHLPGTGAGGARGRQGAFLGAQASLDGQLASGLGEHPSVQGHVLGPGGWGVQKGKASQRYCFSLTDVHELTTWNSSPSPRTEAMRSGC